MEQFSRQESYYYVLCKAKSYLLNPVIGFFLQIYFSAGSVMKEKHESKVSKTSKVETGSKELIGTTSEKDLLLYLFK